MKILKYLAAGFISFIIYTGLFSTLGGYFISSYYALNPDTFRPMSEVSALMPYTTILNLLNGFLFVTGLLIFAKVLPGKTMVKKGMFYGMLMPLVSGSIIGMSYNYIFFNMHYLISIMWSLCVVSGGIINGAITGLLFEKRTPETEEENNNNAEEQENQQESAD